jgi:hypothetical protein
VTRLMGDAIHDNVPALAQAPGLQMVAGYVTGSADIKWTAADWARFSLPEVTIDQGYTGSPVPGADVRDVEAGAWTPAAAVNLSGWTAPQPTIYCSLSVLSQVAQAGWRGAVWVADWTGSPPASPPAVPPGMTCVAVQYSDQGGGGAYDLSVVFDPIWPAEGDPVEAVAVADSGFLWCNKCQGIFYGPNQAVSVCPAGGQHAPQTASGSLNYSMLHAQ